MPLSLGEVGTLKGAVSPKSLGSRMPLVSIVTPAYNVEDYIKHTIESIIAQDYRRIEHIVLDDGSTDSTATVLIEYERDYSLVWFSKPNEGQAITVNRGFELAKGEIVIWLNADDVFLTKDAVSRVVHALMRTGGDVAYGHMAIIDEHNQLVKTLYSPPRLSLDILGLGHYAACVFFRRQVALEYKLNPSIKYAMDYEQALRMAQGNLSFVFIDRPLIGWRRHSSAKSISGRASLLRETSALRRRYCRTSRISQIPIVAQVHLSSLIDKIRGVRDLIRMYKHPEDSLLTECLVIPSLPNLIVRNMLPYT